ncbi:hypothetical protein C806_03478 [Lachnospiraceae bacterium 3-1]|nr:hypothetical protein C806_03478 [Lachnospiraceae bacterium 3-1]
MHIKTMEGLTGANTNYNLLKVPFRVYKDARRRGDMAVMERAMNYASDFAGKVQEYQTEAEEGMEEDSKEAKEHEKLTLEKAIEKRKEEQEKQEEEMQEDTAPKADTLEISETGKAFAKQETVQQPELFGNKPAISKEPTFYSNTGIAEPIGKIGGILHITV